MQASFIRCKSLFFVFLLFPSVLFSHGHGTKLTKKQGEFFVEHEKEEKDLDKIFHLTFSGYVRLDSFFDSRQNVDYWRGLDLAFPKNKDLDPDGCDINDKSQFNMVPYVNLSLLVEGPEIFGAKSSAKLKTDFAGKVAADLIDEGLLSDYGDLRLQHGYAKLDWENTELRVGLYYHPMTILRFSTDTVSINAGEMFDPFQYSAQVYCKHRINNLELIGSLGKLYHRQVSRDAVYPNMLAQANINIGEHCVGCGVDFRMEVPRLETNQGYKTDQSVKSPCCFAVAKMKHNNVTWISRVMYAENAYAYGLLGGYGVKTRDETTDRRDYTNIRSVSCWTDFSYNNKRWEAACFMGFAKNIGSRHTILTSGDDFLAYGLGLNIDKLFRFQPRVRIFKGPMTFGLELEHTRAWYGTMNACGKVDNACPVGNTRILGSVIYAW